MDIDGSLALISSEVENAMNKLGIEIDSQELMQLMQRVDLNGDGQISFDEFQKVTALKLHLMSQVGCEGWMGWGGVGWDGIGWDGWDGKGWDGMGYGLIGWGGRDGMRLDGMEWDGAGWDGVGLDGLVWDGTG